MRETAPRCDKGTNGCVGSVDTSVQTPTVAEKSRQQAGSTQGTLNDGWLRRLFGNMPMLSGLTKYVHGSSFGEPLGERISHLGRQAVQQL